MTEQEPSSRDNAPVKLEIRHLLILTTLFGLTMAAIDIPRRRAERFLADLQSPDASRVLQSVHFDYGDNRGFVEAQLEQSNAVSVWVEPASISDYAFMRREVLVSVPHHAPGGASEAFFEVGLFGIQCRSCWVIKNPGTRAVIQCHSAVRVTAPFESHRRSSHTAVRSDTQRLSDDG